MTELFYTIWYWVSDRLYDLRWKVQTATERLICKYRGHRPTYQQDGSCWEPNVEVYCERCWERL